MYDKLTNYSSSKLIIKPIKAWYRISKHTTEFFHSKKVTYQVHVTKLLFSGPFQEISGSKFLSYIKNSYTCMHPISWINQDNNQWHSGQLCNKMLHFCICRSQKCQIFFEQKLFSIGLTTNFWTIPSKNKEVMCRKTAILIVAVWHQVLANVSSCL